MLKAFNSHHNGPTMASRIFAFIVWAAVAASLAYWGLRWLTPNVGVPSSATSVKLGGQLQGDFRNLLVARNAPQEAPSADPGAASQLISRIRILGAVAAAGAQDAGVALMSIDGKPPRAVRVGNTIDGDMVLLGINQRQAAIGPSGGPAVAHVDLPRLTPASTGTLPPPSGLIVTPPPTPPQVSPAMPSQVPPGGAPMMPPTMPEGAGGVEGSDSSPPQIDR